MNNELDDCSRGDIGWTSNSVTDNDGDGCRDASREDSDDDNDGIVDELDLGSYGGRLCRLYEDCDEDGFNDNEDLDRDNDGLIEVSTPAELDAIRYASNGRGRRINQDTQLNTSGCGHGGCDGYELVTDLAIGSYIDESYPGEGWQPIAHDTSQSSKSVCESEGFRAVFEGNNFTVSGLSINRPYQACIGLFGLAIGAEIRNLRVVASKITGDHSIGGLIGRARNTTIVASSTKITRLISGDIDIGGLVGHAPSSIKIVSSSVVATNISGNLNVGGLVGGGNSSKIKDSSVEVGSISGEFQLGGLIGYGENSIVITSSSALIGSINGANFIGGLVGWGYSNNIKSSSVQVGSISGKRALGGLIGYGENSMIRSSSTLIGSINGTNNIGGILAAGLNATIIESESKILNSIIGNNLTGGLVGWGANSLITGSSVRVGDSISGNDFVGGLVGWGGYGHIKQSSAKVTGSVSGNDYVGGLSGEGSYGSIKQSSAQVGSISGNNFVGGLAGNMVYSEIGNSSANISRSIDGNIVVGGLVGQAGGSNISSSHAFASSINGFASVGGLAGASHYANITSSSANISSLINGTLGIGGLVGLAIRASIASSSARVGSIQGTSWVGGLLGSTFSSDSGGVIVSSSVVAGSIRGRPSPEIARPSAIGGLVGDANNMQIISSSAEIAGPIEGYHRIGGLVGSSGRGTSIFSSSARADSISGNQLLGGMVGIMNGGELVSSFAITGNIDGETALGGMVGILNGGELISSFAIAGNISGETTVGGLIGRSDQTFISDSYAVADFVQGRFGIGGGIGISVATVIHTSFILSGPIRGQYFFGGMVGQEDPFTRGSTFDSYWNINTSGINRIGTGEAKTTHELLSSTADTELYEKWNMRRLLSDDDGIVYVKTAYCDTNHNGKIDDIERREDNHIWDFGTSTQYPAIRCTSLTPTEQRKLYRNRAHSPPIQPNIELTFIPTKGAIQILIGPSSNFDEADFIEIYAASQNQTLKRRLRRDELNDFYNFSGLEDGVAYRFSINGSDEEGNEWSIRIDYAEPINEEDIRSQGIAPGSNYDKDGQADSIDLDDDNDGVMDRNGSLMIDLCPLGEKGWLSNKSSDNDGDGCRDASEDKDDDNDEVADEMDLGSYQDRECRLYQDCDQDSYEDSADIDDDADGLIEVKTAAELSAIRYVLNGTGRRPIRLAPLNSTGCSRPDCYGYELMRDLDLSNYIENLYPDTGWPPIIGLNTDPKSILCQKEGFSGIFDGNNHSLSGISIKRPQQDCTGLFGYLSGGEIRNLIVIVNEIKADEAVAGLVGAGSDSKIVSTSLVAGSISGNSDIGGLVGSGINNEIISSSVVVANISGKNNNIGGLVGFDFTAKIISSSAMVINISGNDDLGGLIGSGSNSAISSSFALITNINGNNNIGALAGDARGAAIFSSYVIAPYISGNDNIGGLVGNGENTKIASSFAVTGPIVGNNHLGGLMGKVDSNSNISHAYWDKDTSSIEMSEHAKTTDELQSPTNYSSIYDRWDEPNLNGNGIWCDSNNDGLISANEQREDNLVWDFGTDMEYPAIKCTSLAPDEQRDSY